jgi:hypothetical protein
VGDSDIADDMAQYYVQLNRVEKNAVGILAPSYKVKQFKDRDELFTYIAAEDYGTTTHKGICLGYEIIENEANQNYSMTFYFADSASTAGHFSNGVPS